MTEHATNDELKLLSVYSLADLLELSPSRVRRMAASGQLPEPLRFGRSLRWRRSQILAWFDASLPDQTKSQTIKIETRVRGSTLTRA